MDWYVRCQVFLYFWVVFLVLDLYSAVVVSFGIYFVWYFMMVGSAVCLIFGLFKFET